MDGLINLCYFGWEESQIPSELVQIFNRYVDGFLVYSHFIKKVLIDSGVYKPIQVTGLGIEQVLREERKTYSGYLGKSFRFLHISSGFPRKGLDVLLQWLDHIDLALVSDRLNCDGPKKNQDLIQ